MAIPNFEKNNQNISNAEPVVSVYCDSTSWVGEPEKGFWCYRSPENPGPRENQDREDQTEPGYI